MNIVQLNKEYGIANQLSFVEGDGGIPFISICNKSAEARISLHGGQVLSYCPASEKEDLLFLSDKAYYDGEKAIRGGVPVCWPWFGADAEGLGRPSHGFARNSMWEVSHTQRITENETKVKLRLIQTAGYSDMWPYSFDLSLEITVANTLTLELVTSNTGEKAFSITQALHSYFQVGEIEKVKVLGLEDKQYLDKLEDYRQKKQIGTISVSEEVDRIYEDVKKQLIIEDYVLKRRVQITSQGNKTAVVWNPWAKTCAKMPDLEANDYQQFICVEAGNAGFDVVKILPGNKHSLLTNFKILKDMELKESGGTA